MHRLIMRWILCCLIVLTSASIKAQDNNFWTRQYGSISSVLAGAVVGSHNDNGSIYYNPATLAFTDSIKISLSAALYETSQWRVGNAIEKDSALNSLGFKRFPVAFFPAFNLKKNYKIGLIYLPRFYCSFRLHTSETNYADVMNNNKPVKVFTSFDYSNDVDESWYGVSVSKKINDYSSVGIIPFVSYRYQEYSYQYSADALLDSLNYKYIDTYVHKYVNYYTYKLIMKLGYYYAAKSASFGAAATIPVFTFLSSGLTNARVSLTGYDAVYPQADNQYLAVSEQDDLKARHKYPVTISLGCKFLWPKCILYFSTESFFAVKNYDILEVDEEQTMFPDYAGISSSDLIGVKSASRFLTNAAVGAQFKYKKNKTMSVGFSTDFNSLPQSYKLTGTNINTSNWDIYHLSTGVDVNVKKFKVSLGLRTSYGMKKDNYQFADIQSQSADNLLYGYPQPISNYSYWDFSVLLGLNF